MAMAVYPPYKANEGGVVVYPRDASFSSYLDSTERDFMRSLADSIYSPSSPTRENSTPRVSIRKNQTPRNELGVFGAERYFNDKLDDKKAVPNPATPRKGGRGGGVGRERPRPRREKRVDPLERRPSKSTTTTTTSSFKSPTPSLKSESSWSNSHIGLLLPKKAGVGFRFFSGLQCKGSCFDVKSVHNPHRSPSPSSSYHKNAPRKHRISHQENFAFPIIDTASPRPYAQNKVVSEEQARKSIEVFGIHQLGKKEIEKSLEKKLSILAWDAIPSPPSSIAFPLSGTPKRSNSAFDREDARSDASSDLFEIETLQGVALTPTSLASDMPMSTPKTRFYAPSEASIEWSEATASAADFSSLVSDREDYENVVLGRFGEKKIGNGMMMMNKVQRVNSSVGGGGLLLGCKNHKAIDVVVSSFDHVKGSPGIAPSTPSRKSLPQQATRSRVKNYALAYA